MALRAALRPHDLVSLDWVMPVCRRQHALRELIAIRPRSRSSCCRSFAYSPAKGEMARTGRAGHLTNPFALAELIARQAPAARRSSPPGEIIRSGGVALDAAIWSRYRARAGVAHQAGVPASASTQWPPWSRCPRACCSPPSGHDVDPGSQHHRRLHSGACASKLGFDLIKTVRGEGYHSSLA